MHIIGWILTVWLVALIAALIFVLHWLRLPRQKPWRANGR